MPCDWVCAILFGKFTLGIEGVDPQEKKEGGGGQRPSPPGTRAFTSQGLGRLSAERGKQGVGEFNQGPRMKMKKRENLIGWPHNMGTDRVNLPLHASYEPTHSSPKWEREGCQGSLCLFVKVRDRRWGMV